LPNDNHEFDIDHILRKIWIEQEYNDTLAWTCFQAQNRINELKIANSPQVSGVTNHVSSHVDDEDKIWTSLRPF
jgi:hypothetical protein